VTKLDLDTALRRFGNLNPDVAPQSLRDYRSRLERAISLFVGYRRDPLTFRVPGARRPSNSHAVREDPHRKRAAGRKQKSGDATPDSGFAPAPTPILPQGLSYPFPLRPDVTLLVSNVPRDFKLTEAERVAAFLRSLSEDYKP
jgi:hypothetical protein